MESMSSAKKEIFEPILQWRKLSGENPGKGTTCYSVQNYDSLNKQSTDAQQSSAFSRKAKVSKQVIINQEEKMLRKQWSDAMKRRRVPSDGNKGKLNIVQNKKAQFSHLVSSQKVMPKDNDQRPIVYNSLEQEQGRKEVAALWLQPFTVVDDY